MKIKNFIFVITASSVLLSFGGCQNNSSTYTEILSEEDAEKYSTAATMSEIVDTEETPVSTIPAEITEEDDSLIAAKTREELAKGLLEAICAGDKDTVERYGVSNKNYISMQEALTNGKKETELSDTDQVSVSDFEIYITGPYKGNICESLKSEYDKAFVYVISPTLTTVSFHFQIIYDYDIEQYIIDSAFVDGTHYDKLLPRLSNEQPIH